MATGRIITKELSILTRDRRALATLIVMPIVFIAILGFSTGQMMGWKGRNDVLKLVMAQGGADDGASVNEAVAEVLDRIVESMEQRSGVELDRVDDPREARLLVDDSERVAAIIVGPAFGERIDELTLADLLDPSGGRLADGVTALDLEVYTRPTQVIVGSIVEQLLYGQTVKAVLPLVARKNPMARMYLESQQAVATQAAEASQVEPDRPTQSPGDLDVSDVVYQTLVPAYTVLFTFFLINIMARSFLAERERGTLRRLQAAPIGEASLLAGKLVPFFFVSIGQGILLFVFGKLLFGMNWGPMPVMLLPVIVCTSLAATTLGLLTSVLVRSDAQVSAYANLLVITLAGISGCFMPRQWLPETMRQISLATPHAWSLIAYDQLLNTASPDILRVGNACGVLIVFSAGFFLLGIWRYRRQLGA